ncbi:MAG: hypothetical protein NT023_14190 [Armatimonadetes bacterium]|nr:hypothetical protein [Armatimonadota bacterium]
MLPTPPLHLERRQISPPPIVLPPPSELLQLPKLGTPTTKKRKPKAKPSE